MSVRVICTCDFCKKEITGKIGYIGMSFRKDNAFDGDLTGEPDTFKDHHFCEECMDKITAFIKAGKQEEIEILPPVTTKKKCSEEGKG